MQSETPKDRPQVLSPEFFTVYTFADFKRELARRSTVATDQAKVDAKVDQAEA